MGGDGPAGSPGLPGTCQRAVNVIPCKIGPTGPDGYNGPIGSKGPQGPQGLKGDIGEKGRQGQKGRRGRSGRRGSSGMLTAIECRDRSTRFSRPNKFKNGRHSFECNNKREEFLQGFSIEARGHKIRYNYRCCFFTKTF